MKMMHLITVATHTRIMVCLRLGIQDKFVSVDSPNSDAEGCLHNDLIHLCNMKFLCHKFDDMTIWRWHFRAWHWPITILRNSSYLQQALTISFCPRIYSVAGSLSRRTIRIWGHRYCTARLWKRCGFRDNDLYAVNCHGKNWDFKCEIMN